MTPANKRELSNVPFFSNNWRAVHAKNRGSRSVASHRGFTLIEILMAMAIFALVLTAIYATWTLILKSKKIGVEAAAQLQRERVAWRSIDEALSCVRSFQADQQHYAFVAENGGTPSLSFVARLPESFPRSGRFGDFDTRRVIVSLEGGRDGQQQLVLRQHPVLMELDRDEEENPYVLANGVDKMEFEFWDQRKNDWVDEWTQTNQLPKMLKLTLEFVRRDPDHPYGAAVAREEISRIIQLPSAMVPAAFQTPNQTQGGPPPPPPPP
jgi:type II secretion system protein J